MIGIGTIVNMLAVIVGTSVGLVLRKGLPKKISEIIDMAIGLATIFIGISGAMAGLLVITEGNLGTQNSMILISSLILGGILGEIVDIEKRMENLGEWIKKRLIKAEASDDKFVEGFVTSSLVFCVGAMAIVGALNDALLLDPSTLFAKAVLDGVISIVFATSFGFGIYLSAISILVYQGSITALAIYIKPYMTEVLISRMSFVGSALIFCIGINFIFGKKIRTGNLLPAMFIPIILHIFGI